MLVNTRYIPEVQSGIVAGKEKDRERWEWGADKNVRGVNRRNGTSWQESVV